MLFGAKNGRVAIGNPDMDYVCFGYGQIPLVLIPGLGDGLVTVKGKALPLAYAYRIFAKQFKVYVFSRKNALEQHTAIRQMAHDQAQAMQMLGIEKANVIGVSQGGMIAQWLAIDHPEMVTRLVLAVTLSRQNDKVQAVLSHWITMAMQGDFKGIMVDTAEKSYSEKYLKRYRMLFPLLGLMGKPKSFERFLIQANACLNHDAYDALSQIACPTLIIGGDSDQIVGTKAAPEMAGMINGSELFVYKGLGHAAYEEASDFNQRIIDFVSVSNCNK